MPLSPRHVGRQWESGPFFKEVPTMAAVKRPPLPVILVANDLLEGDVVFAAIVEGSTRWTRNPREAQVAINEAQALALENFAAGEYRQSRVVDPYLVDVELNSEGLPFPRHYRELLRTLGPSNRRDLGKQTDFQL
jgi:sulfite reductase (NADPH) hemoprotein beta-component